MEEGGEHTSLLVKVRRTCCRFASPESELALACLPRNGLFVGFGDNARQEQNGVLELRAFVSEKRRFGHPSFILSFTIWGYESRPVEQTDGHLIVTCMHSELLVNI